MGGHRPHGHGLRHNRRDQPPVAGPSQRRHDLRQAGAIQPDQQGKSHNHDNARQRAQAVDTARRPRDPDRCHVTAFLSDGCETRVR